jgi:hypothetical protein
MQLPKRNTYFVQETTVMRLSEFDPNGMGATDAGWSAIDGSRPIADIRRERLNVGDDVKRRLQIGTLDVTVGGKSSKA